MDSLPTLLIPDKADCERLAMADAWRAAGGRVREVGKFWVPLQMEPGERACLYGNEVFGLVLAEVNGWRLETVDDAMIARLDAQWTQRSIRLVQIGELQQLDFPCFVKPVKPKQFPAKVYSDWEALKSVVPGLDVEEGTLVSDVVKILAEARAFVLEGRLMDLALYEGEGDLRTGQEFLEEFLEQQPPDLPRTYVIDIACTTDRGWMVLEFNSTWGAGLNGCDPAKVLPCIAAATHSHPPLKP